MWVREPRTLSIKLCEWCVGVLQGESLASFHHPSKAPAILERGERGGAPPATARLCCLGLLIWKVKAVQSPPEGL